MPLLPIKIRPRFDEEVHDDDLLLLETILGLIGLFLHIRDVAGLESCCKRFQSITGPICE